MVKAKNFFSWTLDEIKNYLYDKFPLDIERTKSITTILLDIGVDGNLILHLLPTSSRISKKGQFSAVIDYFEPDRIILFSEYYCKSVVISRIFSAEPKIELIEVIPITS